LTIVDGSGSVLFSTGSTTIGSNHFTFGNISSTTGIGILVQDPFLVGIDNIQFIVHTPGPIAGAGLPGLIFAGAGGDGGRRSPEHFAPLIDAIQKALAVSVCGSRRSSNHRHL